MFLTYKPQLQLATERYLCSRYRVPSFCCSDCRCCMGCHRVSVLVAYRGETRVGQSAGRVRSCLTFVKCCADRNPRFCLNIGWLYTRLVAFNSFENQPSVSIGHTETNPSSPTEATSLLGTSANVYLTDSITEFMAM